MKPGPKWLGRDLLPLRHRKLLPDRQPGEHERIVLWVNAGEAAFLLASHRPRPQRRPI